MTFLDRDLATAALCWRLERRDGVAIGLTTHDRDLVVDGLVYRAGPGMFPSAVSVSDGFDAEALDVEGALSSDAIRGVDIDAGRWDGATVLIFMVDWESPDDAQLYVARGELGDISVNGDAFEAELRGRVALLDRPVVEQTSPECRAQLGDKRCRVDMAGRSAVTRVASADGAVVHVAGPVAAGNAHGYGRLRWIGGANSGLESEIASSDGGRLTLREAPRLAAMPGDVVLLSEGCDKSFGTCGGRFGNAENFRGEPHLPGMDLLTRYPGA